METLYEINNLLKRKTERKKLWNALGFNPPAVEESYYYAQISCLINKLSKDIREIKSQLFQLYKQHKQIKNQQHFADAFNGLDAIVKLIKTLK